MNNKTKKIVIILVSIAIISLFLKLHTFDFSIPVHFDDLRYSLDAIQYSQGDYFIPQKKNPGWSLFVTPFYMMMNSDIYSTVLSGHKIIVVVPDNGGYAIINRLQNYKGGASFNNLIKDSRVRGPFSVDFAKHAESMGAYGRRVETLGELDEAMKWAQVNDKTTVLAIPSDAYEWTPGDAAWDVGVPEVSERDSVNDARKDHDAIRAKQRIGV